MRARLLTSVATDIATSIARSIAVALAVAAVILGAPATAHATMVLPLTLSQLTDKAERVAVALVEGSEARWTSDHNAIFTEVTLRVLMPLKGGGSEGEVITVRREGGEVGGVGMRVLGAPAFTVGEETVVFLAKRGTSSFWTVGMAQGKINVHVVNGQRMAVRNNAGLAFAATPVEEPQSEPLDELVARIAYRVRGGQK